MFNPNTMSKKGRKGEKKEVKEGRKRGGRKERGRER
jgi:hypothetical protein